MIPALSLGKSIYVTGWQAKYWKRYIEYLNRYCTGESIDLKTFAIEITNEIAKPMVPLLARVQKLEFHRCEWSHPFLKNLPTWSPELRELKFSANYQWMLCNSRNLHFESLHGKFLKLDLISFNEQNWEVHNEKFLKQNPQLR